MSKYVGRIITDQAPAGYSVFFDGTGDYLTVANNAAFGFGTGNFTVECWVYPSSFSANQTLVDARSSNSATPWLLGIGSTGLARTYDGSTARTGGQLTASAWNHVAWSRSGSTNNVYVNGVLGHTWSGNTDFDSSKGLTIGSGVGTTGELLTGYISNLRILKGTALYTAAFTPPTQLLNVTNTSILTCNSPAIVDQSSNAFAITTNGNAAVSTFTPFAAYNPYNPALGASTPGVWTLDEAMQAAATRQWNMYDPSFQNTTLLLHGNGTNGAQNNTFLDSSSNNFTITRNGNTTQGSFSPFSQTGWSVNYGANNYWQAPASTNWDIFGGAFTVEMWVYLTGFTGDVNQGVFMIGNYTGGGGGSGWSIGATSSASPTLQITYWNGGPGTGVNSTGVIPLNAWTHIAVTRSGNTIFFYMNGVSVGTAAAPSVAAGDKLTSGAYTQNFVYPSWVYGSISNIRIIKGTALYSGTGSFTPPTGPLTAVPNTVFLGNQSNRFVDNGPNNVAITTFGAPSIQSFSPFYPTAAYTPATIGGSGYFDGTGDCLTSSFGTAIGTGDFTMEAWVYPTTAFVNTYSDVFIVSGGYGLLVNNGQLRFYGITNSTVGGSVVVNAWNHVAAARSGSTIRLFLNGVQTASSTSTDNITGTNLFIGSWTDASSELWTGYISGGRILVGTALYTTAFTPPTSPPTAISNTRILLNYTNAGITDATAKNVLETVGNAQISTTQSKFGGSSMYFDGTGDYLSTIATPNLALGSGDFTIEAWVYANSLGSFNGVVAQWPVNGGSTSNSFVFESVGSNMEFYWSSGSTLYGPATLGTISTGTWTHYAICRSGNTLYPFKNGVLGSTVSITQTLNSPTSAVTVGGLVAGSGFWNGYIDDLRITRGIARYIGNFTPQTSQWQDQ